MFITWLIKRLIIIQKYMYILVSFFTNTDHMYFKITFLRYYLIRVLETTREEIDLRSSVDNEAESWNYRPRP